MQTQPRGSSSSRATRGEGDDDEAAAPAPTWTMARHAHLAQAAVRFIGALEMLNAGHALVALAAALSQAPARATPRHHALLRVALAYAVAEALTSLRVYLDINWARHLPQRASFRYAMAASSRSRGLDWLAGPYAGGDEARRAPSSMWAPASRGRRRVGSSN